MEEIAGENLIEEQKSQISIRCARAAILLSSLKRSPNCRLDSSTDHQSECEFVTNLKRDVEDLKIDLVRERMKTKKLRSCNLMELILLQLAILLFLSSLTLNCLLLDRL